MAGELRYDNATGNLVYSGVSGSLVYDCSSPGCTNCDPGTFRNTKKVTITAPANSACSDCASLAGTYIVTADSACGYQYVNSGLSCGGLTITLDFSATQASVALIAGSGAVGNALFVKNLTAPYDCGTEVNGTYTFDSDTSTECNFSGITVTVSD